MSVRAGSAISAWPDCTVINGTLTMLSSPAIGAEAFITSSFLFHAVSSVVTRHDETALLDVSFASFPGKARLAAALKVINKIHTSSSIGAAVCSTVVDVVLAMEAVPATGAHAYEADIKVQTSSSVLARIRFTVVYLVTVASFKALSARAGVVVDKIHTACSVETGLSEAFVDVGALVGRFIPREAWRTHTFKVTHFTS